MDCNLKVNFTRLNTQNCCFFCLKDIHLNNEAILHLEGSYTTFPVNLLRRFLKINSAEKKNENGFVDNCPAEEDKSNQIEVIFCQSCKLMGNRISQLLMQLEKIQMEIHYHLNGVKVIMDEASNNPQIVQNYSRKMTSDMMDSLTQLLIVDKLRKELVDNVHPGNGWPKVNLDKLSNEEIAKAVERKNVNKDPADQSDSFEGNDFESPEDEVELQQLNNINVKPQAVDPLAFEIMEVSMQMNNSKPKKRGRKRLHPVGQRLQCTSEACLRNHSLKTWSIGSGGDESSNKQLPTKCIYNHETGKYQCQVCFKQFSTEICGTAHYNNTHLNSDCPNCGKQFSRRDQMLRHMRETHLRQRTYKCSNCRKKFKRSEHLQKHQRCFIGRDCRVDRNRTDVRTNASALVECSIEEVPSEPIVNLITVFKTE